MKNNSDNFYPVAFKFILSMVSKQAELLEIEIEEEEAESLSLLDSGLFDSLSFLELLGSIDDEFNIEIDLSEKDPEDFTTINGLTTIVVNSNNLLTETGSDMKEDFSQNLTYQELTRNHPQWQNVGKLFGKMYNSFRGKGIKLPLTDNGEEIWLRSLKASSNNTNQFIGCFDGEQLIGYIQAAIKLLPAYLAGNTTGFIGGIYIDPEYRGRGIAEELLRLAENWFKERGIETVELQVLDQNETAVEFWKKTGYQTELIQMRKFLE